MNRATAEIASLFAVKPQIGANFGEEVYPGYPGLVVGEGQARVMNWGFPLVLIGKKGQQLKPKSVNNTRTDKLESAFWRASFRARRCLIPVTSWAEAEGVPRQMTRTWHALPDHEPFAVAGVWRPTAEWGNAYSMVMADGCPQMADVHDRMPVILARDDWQHWLDGSPEEAFALCRTWDGPLTIERSPEAWFRAKSPSLEAR